MIILQTKRLGIFYRKLATLVTSGTSVIEAMDIVSSQMSSSEFRYACLQIKQHLSQGGSFGDAFSKFPDIFPAWQVNIVKYSETAGRLGVGLSRLADYLERDYSTQMHVVIGLAYPVLLLHIAIFLLPVVDFVTCGAGSYIAGVLKLIIPIYGTLFLIYLSSRLLKRPQFKIIFDGFVLGIPVLGNIARQLALTQFIRALQCLSSSGVTIIGAWKMAAEACGNKVIKSAVLKGLPLIEQGQGLSKAFIQARVFSRDMIGMMATAEKSGSIVQMLDTIAGYSEKENETAVAVLARIMPVFVYLVIAGYIGYRIISFYLGYFNKVFSF